ncbi:MAG: hypothetical protein VX498_14670 [Myxococcota bacterium]|nr:hypothetical protein [Myxococcota bacterium]
MTVVGFARRCLPPALAALLLAGALACDADGGFAEGFRLDDDYRREAFVQSEAESTDILWVIDTSGSMIDEQAALAEHFPAFIEFFVDWDIPFRMGITSTNVGEEDSEGLDGRLVGEPPWIDSDEEDVEAAFVERALLGIDHRHGEERGLHASYTALGTLLDGVNEGFLREEASLVVLVVSDEPDYSTLSASDAEDWIDWSSYATWMDGLKGDAPEDAERSHFSSIVGVGEEGLDDPDGCLHGGLEGEGSLENGALRGDGYIEASIATGGTVQSICSEDWTETLGRLGLTSAGLSDRFPLSDVPVPGSIVVRVSGSQVEGWSYDSVLASVVFEITGIPEAGEEVVVTYLAQVDEVE